MNTTIGTCSVCGGRVVVPSAWYCVYPPIPTCENCGATASQPHGPIVPMQPSPYKITYTTDSTDKIPKIEAVDSSGKKLLID